MTAPEISVVIPVYNEEEVLPALFARLYPALDALGRTYEVLFVNDGSRDRSTALLREQFQDRPDVMARYHVVLRGAMDARKFSACYLRDGVFVACHAVNMGKDFLQSKKLISHRVRPDPSLLADPHSPLQSFLPAAG